MKSIAPQPAVSLFVRNILLFENADASPKTILPFFPDGYPGLLYHQSSGLRVQPQDKLMPAGFLHGQTLQPIELHVQGDYRMVVFQLYPFVLQSFFGIDAKSLNDGCFDMRQVPGWADVEMALKAMPEVDQQVELITSFLLQVFDSRQEELDFLVRDAIKLILDKQSQIAVKELCEQLHVTTRTFERRFLGATGVSAKDFIQITKFQQSLEQLTSQAYNKLTDIVYANGYADQSHFIRVFKAFTGKTPSKFIKQE